MNVLLQWVFVLLIFWTKSSTCFEKYLKTTLHSLQTAVLHLPKKSSESIFTHTGHKPECRLLQKVEKYDRQPWCTSVSLLWLWSMEWRQKTAHAKISSGWSIYTHFQHTWHCPCRRLQKTGWMTHFNSQVYRNACVWSLDSPDEVKVEMDGFTADCQ